MIMQSQLILSTKLTAANTTQIDDYFVSPPFKLMTLPSTHQLKAVQMSSSPGLLAGDKLFIQLRLAENTDLALTTQAFTRVQSMNENEWAEQHSEFHLAKNSRLFYLPHPLVLHKDSALKQTTTITMADNSQLIYGEIVAIGRVLNQERFAFRQFSSYLKITHQDRPLLIDRIQWHPAKMNLTALSQMEDFSHQGTFVYLNLAADTLTLKQQLAELQQSYATEQQLLIGFSLLNDGGFTIRVLGHRAETIEKFFLQIGERLCCSFPGNII